MAGCEGLPVRSVMFIMIFFGAWTSFLLRVDLSYALVDMVPPEAAVLAVDVECVGAAEELSTTSTEWPWITEVLDLVIYHQDKRSIKESNDSEKEEEEEERRSPSPDAAANNSSRVEDPRVPWSRMDCAHLLAAFSYGQTVAHLSGARAVKRLGPKRVVGWSMVLAAAANLIFPFAAVRGFLAAMLVRFTTGLFAGYMLPAMLVSVERWMPRKEAIVYIWYALGGGTSVALAWPLFATLTSSLGWPWVFFCASGVCMVWGVLWLTIGSDGGGGAAMTEAEMEEERARERPQWSNEGGKRVPWARIYSSPSVQALLCLHCSHLYAEAFLFLHGPFFFRQVLGFNPLFTSLLLMLTTCGRTVVGVAAAGVVRITTLRRLCYAITARKATALLSHAAPAGLLLWALLRLCDAKECTAAICAIALALAGAGGEAAPALCSRLTRHYRGEIIFLLNVAGSLIGVSAPLFVGSLTAEENAVKTWRGAVGSVAAMLAFGCLMFLALGSTRQQSWDVVCANTAPAFQLAPVRSATTAGAGAEMATHRRPPLAAATGKEETTTTPTDAQIVSVPALTPYSVSRSVIAVEEGGTHFPNAPAAVDPAPHGLYTPE